MYCTPFILILALVTLSLATENRKFHRPRGNRFRINDPDPDDAELIQIEASGSIKQKDKTPEKGTETEKVKTLSQQVADGKYGLIQKELFSKPPKRPGILSYNDNPEVPNDNINNLGGLDKSEIWLAENHLLVLKGGIYPPHDDKNDHPESIWPPIDDYKAPLHQVKIPSNPKVPPPFPVQLTEDGPLQILGTNFSRPFNETDQPPFYAIPPPEGFPEGPFFPPFYPNSTDIAPGQTPLPIPIKPSGEYQGGVPVPPPNLNETWPPFFGYLPPGAVILPPPENQTEYDDEDPSIYYPPPYSFFYPKDNSSLVPAGPLVPGIVLPPPPNFFASLDESPKQGITTTRKQQKQRKPLSTKTYSPIYTTTTQLPPTTTTKQFNTEKPIKIYPVKDQYLKNEISKKTTTEAPKVITILPVKQQERTYLPPQTNKPSTQLQRKKPENITILRPVPIITTPAPQVYILNNEIPNKPFRQYGPPNINKKIPVSTTQIPLKYYTTSNAVETSTQSPNKYESTSKTKEAKPTKSAQYFYYEEPETNLPRTPKVPVQSNTFIDTTESYFKTPKPTTTVRQRRPQYIYVTARPYNTQKPRFRFIQQPVKTDSFSIHIAKLQNHIHQYYTTQRPNTRPSPKPVYQYSFQAANYQPQDDFKPSPEIGESDNFKPIHKYNEDIRSDLQKPSVPISQSDFRRPKYTVEIQQAIEIIPTKSPQYNENPVFYQQYQKTTPRPENYYTTLRPSYQFEEVTQKPQFLQSVTTSKPISQYSFGVTSNPIYQGFYTKPDEGFFDENTREYFTVFGRKLPSGTTPLPGYDIPDAFTSQNEQHTQYQEQKPISLESDTVVNYVNPRPAMNPQSEFIPAKNSRDPQNYSNVVRYTSRPQNKQRERGPEIVKAIPVDIPTKQDDGSYISYQLPGDDGAHFYFITPQLATRRDQGAGFYYEQTNARRIRRNQHKSDKES